MGWASMGLNTIATGMTTGWRIEEQQEQQDHPLRGIRMGMCMAGMQQAMRVEPPQAPAFTLTRSERKANQGFRAILMTPPATTPSAHGSTDVPLHGVRCCSVESLG